MPHPVTATLTLSTCSRHHVSRFSILSWAQPMVLHFFVHEMGNGLTLTN